MIITIKKGTCYFVMMMTCVSSVMPLKVENAGVAIRIHVPHVERLANERPQQMIARIENQGSSPLLIMTMGDDSVYELAQFHIETKGSVSHDFARNDSSWEKVRKLADLTVLPGQAIEMISGSAMGLNLPSDGTFRIVLRISEHEYIYSNWVSLVTLPEQDFSEWQVVSETRIAPGELGINHFILGATPSGTWLFRRPLWNKAILHRVSKITDGFLPIVTEDLDHFQAIIQTGPDHGDKSYYSGSLGLSGNNPWPMRHRGGDLINKPLEISSPSPLGFPLELFDDAYPSNVSNPQNNHQAAPVSSRNDLNDEVVDSRNSVFAFYGVIIVVSLASIAIFFMLVRNSKNKSA